METATVISLIALALSGLSVWFTRRVAKVEWDRRHEERTPRLTLAESVAILPDPDGGEVFLATLTNLGPGDVDELHVELLDSKHGTASGVSLTKASDAKTRLMAGALPLGETKGLVFVPAREHASGRIRVRIEAYADGETWRVLVETQVPPRPWGLVV